MQGLTRDVVYVLRPGDHNEELRYSLRSLTNLPHRHVWIAGHCPTWVTGLGHIPTKQIGSKWANSTENLWAAIDHPEVSEEFVLFNDDFFVMTPVDDIPTQHRGPVTGVFDEYHRTGRSASTWCQGMVGIIEVLRELGIPDPVSYELHIPMVLRKDRVREVLSIPLRPSHEAARQSHKRTLYGNYWAIGGEQVPDCKVRHRSQRMIRDGGPFLSTSDHLFRVSPVGRSIRAQFPEPSPYEVPEKKLPSQRQSGAMRTWRHRQDGRVRTVRHGTSADRRYAAWHEWMEEVESDGPALAS